MKIIRKFTHIGLIVILLCTFFVNTGFANAQNIDIEHQNSNEKFQIFLDEHVNNLGQKEGYIVVYNIYNKEIILSEHLD